MFPFWHGWGFSQAPSAHQVFPPSVCCIRRGRIGPSADDLKVFPSRSEPSSFYLWIIPPRGREGKGLFPSAPAQWGLFWRIIGEGAGPTSDLGACGLESDYCQEKSKGKDGQDQMLLERREGEAIEMRLLLQRAGREGCLVLLWPEWTLGSAPWGRVHLKSKPGKQQSGYPEGPSLPNNQI